MFITRPIVILKILCMLFSFIIFYCIEYHGRRFSKSMKRNVCLFNEDELACTLFGIIVPEFTSLVALGSLICEYFFGEKSSSNSKGKKCYLIWDLLFSGTCGILYITGTSYLVYQFSSIEEGPYLNNVSLTGVKASIIASFLSTITWIWCVCIIISRFVFKK